MPTLQSNPQLQAEEDGQLLLQQMESNMRKPHTFEKLLQDAFLGKAGFFWCCGVSLLLFFLPGDYRVPVNSQSSFCSLTCEATSSDIGQDIPKTLTLITLMILNATEGS